VGLLAVCGTPLDFAWMKLEGEDVRRESHHRRQGILESYGSSRSGACAEAAEDGEALWSAVCERELEGVVAKRLCEPYVPNERSWVKVKTGSTGATSSSEKEPSGVGKVAS